MKLGFIFNKQFREEKVLGWASVGLLFFVTGFLWAPSRDGLQVVFAIGFLLPLLTLVPFRRPNFHDYGGWFTCLALIYAAYAALTSFWGIESNPGFFIAQWLVLAIWLTGINLLAVHRLIDWDFLFRSLLILGSLISIIIFISFYGQYPLSTRLEGLLVARNPNEVGALFGILSLLAFCQWLKAKSRCENAEWVLILFCLIVPLILSQSRGAIFALGVTSLTAMFYLGISRLKLVLVLTVMILLTLLMLYQYYYAELTPDRLTAGFRDVIWQEVFARSIHEHLWWGIGLDKDSRIIIPDVDVFNHAHNAWLDTFYRTGLVGLVLALAHLFYVLQKFKSTDKLVPLYLWLMFGLIVTIFDYRIFFWQIDFKWFLFWVPVGLISAAQLQESRMKENSGDKNGS